MVRWTLPLVLIVSGCSKGPEADLQYIKQARSLGSEWALVNEQAAQGKLTSTYVSSMHDWLRSQLQTSLTALAQPQSPYGFEMRALSQMPDDAAPEDLRAHVAKLKRVEDGLESA